MRSCVHDYIARTSTGRTNQAFRHRRTFARDGRLPAVRGQADTRRVWLHACPDRLGGHYRLRLCRARSARLLLRWLCTYRPRSALTHVSLPTTPPTSQCKLCFHCAQRVQVRACTAQTAMPARDNLSFTSSSFALQQTIGNPLHVAPSCMPLFLCCSSTSSWTALQRAP